jgi:hypothetical protein
MRKSAVLALASILFAACVWALPARAAGDDSTSRRGLLKDNSLVFPPLCNCDRKLLNSPYRLVAGVSGPSLGMQRYCFNVQVLDTCDPTSKCCRGQGLSKVEFDVGEQGVWGQEAVPAGGGIGAASHPAMTQARAPGSCMGHWGTR